MSLRVDDSRSRTRSKSPSGRIRERSRSRGPRAPSPPSEKTKDSSKKYYDSDSAEETVYASSRAKKNFSSRDDRYRHSEIHKEPVSKQPPGYYISDEEQILRMHTRPEDPPRPDEYRYHSDYDLRYSKQPGSPRPISKYEQYSDSLTDSEDDALAYGEIHQAHSVPSYERLRDKYTKSSKQYHDSDSVGSSSKYSRPLAKLRGEEIPNPSRYDHDSKSHPSYAQPEHYRYSQPPVLHQNLPGTDPPNKYGNNQNQYPIDWAEVPECERPDFVPPREFNAPAASYAIPDPSPVPHAPNLTSQYPPASQSGHNPQQYDTMQIHSSRRPAPTPTTVRAAASGHHRDHAKDRTPTTQQYYAQPPSFQYAQPDPNIRYISKSAQPYTQSSKNQFVKPYAQTPEANYIEIKPKSTTRRPQSLSISASSNDHMAVPGSFPDAGRPPPSPLLEPYKGTYQSISPMPWPTSVPSHMDEGLSDLEPLDGSTISDTGLGKFKKSKHKDDSGSKSNSMSATVDANIKLIAPAGATKKVSFYDPKPDAKELKASLSHSNVDPKPLLDILPYLTSDDILALRAQYKNIVKLGGKGINMAKHIKVHVPGNFGKVCYATALGRWESEAHWANFWYRSNNLRRELLIESLIGRSNAEIREIKKCFRDKRYGDDLERCMKAELKADKFRTAILLALGERRQSNTASLDHSLIRDDICDLHRALISREGGETAMIQIIIVRGDAHLREVIHLYEDTYHKNFAREMISKSQNLVGETLVHVLNGALNRPMRDALLLHQAISESGMGRERAELLISRLVRMHWEPLHLERVKSEYKRRYRQSVEDAIDQEIIKKDHKDWAEFCLGLVKSSRIHIANGTA
ncbi:hypothetical protein GX48_05226 [Paracoccidioides brasiliensis]|nr:hypothetical protein GX48_05226 [Paracoccidioides brasiliensis]